MAGRRGEIDVNYGNKSKEERDETTNMVVQGMASLCSMNSGENAVQAKKNAVEAVGGPHYFGMNCHPRVVI